MDPSNYEQVDIPATLIGPQAAFLQPEMRVSVEFLDDRPVAVPDARRPRSQYRGHSPAPAQPAGQHLEIREARGRRHHHGPPVIKTGDTIRLDLQSLKYMDRAKAGKRGLHDK